MTKLELLELLKYCDEECDTEIGHYKADGGLLEYINDPEITEAFEKLRKYYA